MYLNHELWFNNIRLDASSASHFLLAEFVGLIGGGEGLDL